MLELDSGFSFHKTTILSLNSIASRIENDHLKNSEDGGAIKRDKKFGRKEQFFTINYLPIVVATGPS
jgi:hypothetical protein